VVLRAADVSKRHCRILLDGDRVWVEDLGSVNGICVNGQPVTRAALHDGDVLDVAGQEFEVRAPRPSAP
jgi:pSer/pThr/pTyr-binding forkhead associated (FHA) protein